MRVMAEYGSSGLWGFSASPRGVFRHGMLEADALGLPAELKARLAAWIAWYEDDNLAGTLDHAAFNAEGRALARLVKAQLPDRHVEYQGEADDGGLLPPEAVG